MKDRERDRQANRDRKTVMRDTDRARETGSERPGDGQMEKYRERQRKR